MHCASAGAGAGAGASASAGADASACAGSLRRIICARQPLPPGKG